MNLYLAEIEYEMTAYEGKTTHHKMTRLVQAENATDAYDKVDQYIRDKTNEYCVYYSATSIEIAETIK